MPATRSMKTSVAPSTRPMGSSQQSTIEAFGRISKATPSKRVYSVSKKALTVDTLESGLENVLSGTSGVQKRSAGRKHTLVESDTENQDSDVDSRAVVKRQRTHRDAKLEPLPTNPQTPRKHPFTPHSLPTPETTPTKHIDIFFTDIPTTPSKQLTGPTFCLASPPSTPNSTQHYQPLHTSQEPCHLPDELEELISLHSSLMKALSIHLAHNGLASPVNVALLCPTVTKIWRTRNVTLTDIRRILGVSQCATREKPVDFKRRNLGMLDYSRGNICIEWPEHQTKLSWQNTTEKLNTQFIDSLESLWSAHLATTSNDETDNAVQSFINALPLAQISLAPSLKKTAPLFAHGQRLLDEFHILARDAQVQAKKQPATPHSSKSLTTTTKPDPKVRTSSLLDRLLAKQTATLASPGPSKLELERRAALHRLPELVSILSTLRRSAVQQRQSHTLQSLVKDMQNSARSPMSREEVEASIRLLAEDIAGEGVRIVDTGAGMGEGCKGKGITAVVVDWPTAGDLAGKVRRAVEALS